MPSFDIVSEVDLQEVDNAVNNVKKELQGRFDFRGSKASVELNKKDKVVRVVAEDEMKMKAIRELLIGNLVKRKVDPRALEFQDIEATSQGMVKRDVTIKEGLDKDSARKITGLIKDAKLKVQAAIQDQQVRVTGKKIDDLQAVIALLRQEDFGFALQFVNMKN